MQRIYFDATGKLIGSEQVAASSGKLFDDDLDPRHTDEYMIGPRSSSPSWTLRVYARFATRDFWEDTKTTRVRVQTACRDSA